MDGCKTQLNQAASAGPPNRQLEDQISTLIGRVRLPKCSEHQSCGTCISSRTRCFWCVQNQTCSSDAAACAGDPFKYIVADGTNPFGFDVSCPDGAVVRSESTVKMTSYLGGFAVAWHLKDREVASQAQMSATAAFVVRCLLADLAKSHVVSAGQAWQVSVRAVVTVYAARHTCGAGPVHCQRVCTYKDPGDEQRRMLILVLGCSDFKVSSDSDTDTDTDWWPRLVQRKRATSMLAV